MDNIPERQICQCCKENYAQVNDYRSHGKGWATTRFMVCFHCFHLRDREFFRKIFKSTVYLFDSRDITNYNRG